ncbi:tyrosine-type recombinase/integrase [Gordonia sp. TBRC 11910]|uniref:Tyrosine-type recombinase/integrase n=1 Tax=Gordonia asplenii TaxID=2725283 RepID=A0A848KS41_9ACTN|nr:tyrosine-type recombinase/integrase [Gordonia asplenii]NMO00787.1 tyrosine-type recombinase/integrase [Gordonia asplenii]
MNEIAMWMTHLHAEGKANRTIKDRRIVLTRFATDLGRPIINATTEDIAEWLGRDDLSPVTRSVYHSMLKNFYAWAIATGRRDDNPILPIRPAKRPRRQPRPITIEQFKRLTATTDVQLRAMVLLGSLQGFRVHEIARFHARHLDPEARTIEVTGKGGATYILPVHDAILAIAHRMPKGYWFPSQRAVHIGGRTVTQRLRLHMIAQRVPGTPHCLRHFYGTELVAGGADLRVAQELLRHASLQTTAIYVATTDDRKRAAIDRLAA